jgi:hypothetical protein
MFDKIEPESLANRLAPQHCMCLQQCRSASARAEAAPPPDKIFYVAPVAPAPGAKASTLQYSKP